MKAYMGKKKNHYLHPCLQSPAITVYDLILFKQTFSHVYLGSKLFQQSLRCQKSFFARYFCVLQIGKAHRKQVGRYISLNTLLLHPFKLLRAMRLHRGVTLVTLCRQQSYTLLMKT